MDRWQEVYRGIGEMYSDHSTVTVLLNIHLSQLKFKSNFNLNKIILLSSLISFNEFCLPCILFY